MTMDVPTSVKIPPMPPMKGYRIRYAEYESDNGKAVGLLHNG